MFRRSVGLVALVSTLALTGCAGLKAHVTSGSSPATETEAPPVTRPSLSAGEKRVNYGDASIVVPANWRIVLPGVRPCGPGVTDNVVLLGTSGKEQPRCQAPSPQPTSFAHLESLPAHVPSGGAQQEINGHAATVIASGPSSATYIVPGLGIELVVVGSRAKPIANSLDWSTRYLVLHPGPTVVVPTGWHSVAYQGMSVRVPESWPLHRVGPKQGAPGCGSEFSAPAVLEGPPVVHRCGIVVSPAASVDGVWLQGPVRRSQVPTAAFAVVRVSPTRVFLDQRYDPAGVEPFLQLFVAARNGAMDAVIVGLGPHPAVARAIVASITTSSSE